MLNLEFWEEEERGKEKNGAWGEFGCWTESISGETSRSGIFESIN